MSLNPQQKTRVSILVTCRKTPSYILKSEAKVQRLKNSEKKRQPDEESGDQRTLTNWEGRQQAIRGVDWPKERTESNWVRRWEERRPQDWEHSNYGWKQLKQFGICLRPGLVKSLKTVYKTWQSCKMHWKKMLHLDITAHTMTSLDKSKCFTGEMCSKCF